MYTCIEEVSFPFCKYLYDSLSNGSLFKCLDEENLDNCSGELRLNENGTACIIPNCAKM